MKRIQSLAVVMVLVTDSVLPAVAVLFFGAPLFAADFSRRAPGFSLPDVNTEQHDLADYRGKVVILEFMQTTCPHCAAFTEVLATNPRAERPDAGVVEFQHWGRRHDGVVVFEGQRTVLLHRRPWFLTDNSKVPVLCSGKSTFR